MDATSAMLLYTYISVKGEKYSIDIDSLLVHNRFFILG